MLRKCNIRELLIAYKYSKLNNCRNAIIRLRSGPKKDVISKKIDYLIHKNQGQTKRTTPIKYFESSSQLKIAKVF
jgi:hypothetical protein